MTKKPTYKIGTLGSHSALQILKGAQDEGFQSVAICEEGRVKPYESFRVADQIITVKDFSEIVDLDNQLAAENVIMIPHGSILNALELEKIGELKAPYFGNKNILAWEVDRTKQREWLANAGLTLPRIYETPESIDGPVIIKFFGAGGGKGYFLAHTPAEFERKIKAHPKKKYIIQEYIVGAPIYIHYFYSPLTNELEVMGFDKRYESNVDSIGRIAAKDQMDLGIETSYNITGNMPLVVRESLLPCIFEMGEDVIKASKAVDGRGLFGPFCLETVITPDLEFFAFEISARIVAGTNPFINGSPYTDLRYSEPMSTGRRIAREVKLAMESDQMDKVLG
ncbi:MAG: phosphoribosylaminoimidazolecarboxamide formyltransferase [Candidatus Saccharibacteria bacterium]|nr:phosphoribosylaminoimidazolecarboxamide formyltransferase [Candidatus Saccharibacteria bacterium]